MTHECEQMNKVNHLIRTYGKFEIDEEDNLMFHSPVNDFVNYSMITICVFCGDEL
jgi:hypothetical protein